MITKDYEIYHADCIRKLHEFKNDGRQFDLAVFSPPFSSLYAYSENPEDMGNSRESDDEFKLHHQFFVNSLFPTIKAGRNVCVHIQQVSRFKGHHGYMGLYDLRGEVIRQFVDAGFIYYGETTIRKCPQAQSIRTKSHALTFTQWEKNSLVSRPCLVDYLLIFKKPGDPARPVKPLENGLNRDMWIDWADAIWHTKMPDLLLPDYVWKDIKETNTLNTKAAKDERDERHVCPLQLDLIERCILLWSNRGEIVLDPFGGIGSTGYVALKHYRKSVSIELKDSYFSENGHNHHQAILERQAAKSQMQLF